MNPIISNATYSASNGSIHPKKQATPSAKSLSRRLRNGIYQLDGCGLLKRCSRCKEHWPADTEFFYSVKDDDGLYQWCKACYQAWRYPNGRKANA